MADEPVRVVALRSAGLPTAELTEAARTVGVEVTVVTSLEEARQRGLPLARVIVDGVGETAEQLRGLARLRDELEVVYWIGFDPPSRSLPGLVLINPLRSVDDIAEALSTAQPADDLTMVPIQLDDDPPEPSPSAHWSEPVVEPPAPLDRPLPTLAPITLHLEEDESIDDLIVDADFQVRRRRVDWKVWLRPAAVAIMIVGASLVWLQAHFREAETIALPEPATTLPTYRIAPAAAAPKRETETKPPAAPVQQTPPQGSAMVAPDQKTSETKKRARVVVPFDEGRLKTCLRRLGKKGARWLTKSGSVRVTMRLGVMGDGRIAAATTSAVRIGRKKYRSSKFNACVEGEVVGQQLGLRPEREPTFVRRTFRIRP